MTECNKVEQAFDEDAVTPEGWDHNEGYGIQESR